MRRVLRQPEVVAEARSLSGGDVASDPAVRARIDQEVAAAYERGRRDGRAEGERAAAEAQSGVVAQVATAVAAAKAELAAARAEDGATAVELALRIAQEIVAVTLTDGTDSLVHRVRQVLTAVDDDAVTLWVNPSETHAVAERLRDVAGLTVEMDATLAAGEARLTGHWCDADLTWDATWDAVGRALRGE